MDIKRSLVMQRREREMSKLNEIRGLIDVAAGQVRDRKEFCLCQTVEQLLCITITIYL